MNFRGLYPRSRIARFAGSFGLVAMLSITAFASSDLANGGSELRRAMVPDLMGLMQNRSPGERGSAELRQSKKSALAVTVAAPRSARALSAVRDSKPRAAGQSREMALETSPFIEDDGTDVMFMPGGEAGPVADIQTALLAPPVSSGGIFIPPSGGGGGIGGGVSNPGDGDIAPIPPVVSAVPEPATWLNMLIGFAAVGLLIRRRRAGTRRGFFSARSRASVRAIS